MPDTQKWGIYPVFSCMFINKGKCPKSQKCHFFQKKRALKTPGWQHWRGGRLPPPPSLMRPPPSNPKRTEEEPEGKREPRRNLPGIGGSVRGSAAEGALASSAGVRALAELKERGNKGGRV